MFAAGTRTLSTRISAGPCGAWSYPNTVRSRTIFTPDVSSGTRIIDCCLCADAEGSLLPMNIAILHRGSPAPEDHHFRPLITYSSPSRTMHDAMLVASEDATSGSVMQKQDRISPANNGFSHFSFWASVP